MSERGSWRNLVEWGGALLLVAAVAAAVLFALGKPPFRGAGGSPPASRTIELFAQADPLNADDVAEAHVADVTVDAAGLAVLARCSDEKIAAQLQAALADMSRQPALALPVEEMRDDGLALGETDVARSDPRYAWAAGRFLSLKTGLSYQVADAAGK